MEFALWWVLPSPCCESLNTCTPQCSYLERNFGLMISRFSGSHGMVYAHEDGSFFMFLFLPLKGCRQATRSMWRVECCNEVELGSQRECHFVPTLSEHSACVCS